VNQRTLARRACAERAADPPPRFHGVEAPRALAKSTYVTDCGVDVALPTSSWPFSLSRVADIARAHRRTKAQSQRGRGHTGEGRTSQTVKDKPSVATVGDTTLLTASSQTITTAGSSYTNHLCDYRRGHRYRLEHRAPTPKPREARDYRGTTITLRLEPLAILTVDSQGPTGRTTRGDSHGSERSRTISGNSLHRGCSNAGGKIGHDQGSAVPTEVQGDHGRFWLVPVLCSREQGSSTRTPASISCRRCPRPKGGLSIG
jgi:hypothetical protein